MSGFIDLQVNGYLGVDFQSEGLSQSAIDLVSRALFERGVAGYLATIVTASRETYRRVLPVLASAMRRGDSRNRLLGLHLEGPFISDQDGAVGAHPKECVAPCDPQILDELIDLSEGAIKLLTVAPERPGALDLIRHACQRGITVSLGHSLAACKEYFAAVESGAALATHVGNGIPQKIARQDNPITACLSQPNLTAMIITDGHHLIDPFIKMVLLNKGVDRVIVTSDAAPPAGLAPGDYVCFGSPARLEPSGYLRNLAAPGLAGSGSNLFECMNHLAKVLDEAPDLVQLITHRQEQETSQSQERDGKCNIESILWTVGRDNPAKALKIDIENLDDSGVIFDDSERRFIKTV